MGELNLPLMLLTAGLHQLPVLLALLFGFLVMARAPASRERTGGVLGLLLVLLAALLGVAAGVVPMLLIQQGQLGMITMVATTLGVLVALLYAGGIAMLAWMLARRLRAAA